MLTICEFQPGEILCEQEQMAKGKLRLHIYCRY